MTTATKDWNEVADSIAALALKLKLHFEEAASGAAADAQTAVDAVGESIESAFDGLRTAVNDPAVKEDVRDVAAGLRDAVTNTFAELSAQLRQSCDRQHSA